MFGVIWCFMFSGGTKVTVIGQKLDVIQDPHMVVYVNNKQYISVCLHSLFLSSYFYHCTKSFDLSYQNYWLTLLKRSGLGTHGGIYSKCVKTNLNFCGSLIAWLFCLAVNSNLLLSWGRMNICNALCWCGWY